MTDKQELTPSLEQQIEADKLKRQDEAGKAIRTVLDSKRCKLAVKAFFVNGVLQTEVQIVAT